jgi:hypothetical protein
MEYSMVNCQNLDVTRRKNERLSFTAGVLLHLRLMAVFTLKEFAFQPQTQQNRSRASGILDRRLKEK